MKHVFSDHFVRQLKKLPMVVERKFYKQLKYLLADIRYPSLRTKKFDETQGIWQARVDDHYRFYFIIDNDAYVLFNILPHRD
ncbi:MAG: hypothetical protein V1704_05045 [Candidatus Vogelbacteria bacterium]